MKIFKTIIVAFVVAGLLSIAQHHHDDFDDHDECLVCALIQNGLDYNGDVPDVAVFLIVVGELACEIRIFKKNPLFHFSRPRAPPILSV